MTNASNQSSTGYMDLVSFMKNCSETKSSPTVPRLIIMAVLMPIVAVLAGSGNLVAFWIFVKRSGSSGKYFLAILALCDAGVLVTACLLYSVEVASEQLDLADLYLAWISYLQIVFCLSHIFQNGAVNITVAATIHQYALIQLPGLRGRKENLQVAIFVGVALLCSIALNATKYLEIDILYRPWCDGQKSKYQPIPSEFAEDGTYDLVYTIWLSNVMAVWLPFLTLTVLNTVIILHMKTNNPAKKSSRIHRDIPTKKSVRERREATIMLLIVVMAFLVCSAPGFALTLAEKIDHKALYQKYPKLYSYSRDFVNAMAIVNSSVNVILYPMFSKQYRLDIKNLSANCCSLTKTERSGSSIKRLKDAKINNHNQKEIMNMNGGYLMNCEGKTASIVSLKTTSDNNGVVTQVLNSDLNHETQV